MEEVQIVQIDTGPSQKSLSDLKKEIKDLKSQLINLEEGTEEYNKVLLEVGDKMHQVKEIQEQTARTTTDLGDRLAATKGSIAGMTGAIQTAVGALSLMGVEMGDDMKVLKTLQSLMAITSGFQAIDSGVKSFKALTISIKASVAASKALRVALMSTGIGAIIVAIGLLAAKMAGFIGSTSKAEKELKAFKSQVDATKKSLDSMKKSSDFAADMAEALGKSADEVRKLRVESAKLRLEQAQLAKDEAFSKWVKAQGKQRDEYKEILDEMTDLEQKAYDDYNTLVQQGIIADAKARTDARKQAAADAKKAAEDRDNQAKADAEAEAKRREDEKKALEAFKEDIQSTKESTSEVEYLKSQADIIIAQEEDMDEQLIQLDMDFNDRKETLLRQRFENGLIGYNEFNEQIAQLELERANLEIELETTKANKIQAIQDKQKQKEAKNLEDRKKKYDDYKKAISTVTSSVSSILGSIGETLEQGSTEWKNVKTAEAIISTIQGGVSAYMGMVESIPGPAGLIAGAAAAAATVAAGMVEVKKIQDTQISTDGSGTAASTGSTALGNVNQQAISVAATQVTNTRQTNTTSDIEDLPDTRVYVLESDITDAQRNVKTTVKQATF